MSTPLLEVRNITYRYDTFQALQETTFSVHKGQILIITGPNGAGKTTLMHCLSGLLQPASGNVLINGHDLYHREPAAKKALAYLPDGPRFYPELTVWEHLRFIAHAHNAGHGFADRAHNLLQEFSLSEAKDLYPHALSRGMRLKLGILLCLIRPFTLLLMDEPTSALDPEGAAVLQNKLGALKENGRSVVLTTHDLSLTRKLGSRTAHMKGGRLAFN